MAAKKMGVVKFNQRLTNIQQKQIKFKLSELAVYAREKDFLLAWTGVMQSRNLVRRKMQLPEISFEDHILAGWRSRIREMMEIVNSLSCPLNLMATFLR